ncbi:MAG: HupE/UreJ family protein [Polyangiaceae bacterium]
MRRLAWLLGCAWLCLAQLAGAHAIGVSRGEYQRSTHGVEVVLLVARGEVLAALPNLSERDLGAGEPALTALLTNSVQVTSASKPCTVRLSRAALTENDGLRAALSFQCPEPNAELEITLGLLRWVGREHRHFAHVSAGSASFDTVLFGAESRFTLPPLSASGTDHPNRLFHMLRMGCEHILSGADHIAFLFALLLGVTRLDSLLRLTFAFSVGHSLSLAAVASRWWTPSPSWVEPAIAFSIAYVAYESLRRPDAPARAWVTLAFGLLHGLGFAGALSQVEVRHSELASSLLSFNLGVELGQVAIVAALLPALALSRRSEWVQKRAVPASAWLLLSLGLAWGVARLV